LRNKRSGRETIGRQRATRATFNPAANPKPLRYCSRALTGMYPIALFIGLLRSTAESCTRR